MKLTRKQSKLCKLTDEDIYNIRREYEMCHNYSLLGRVYGVAKTTIIYWVKNGQRDKILSDAKRNPKRKIQSDEERIKLNARHVDLAKARNEKYTEYHTTNLLENRKRLKEYISRPENIIRVKAYRKEYMARPEVALRYKEYYQSPEYKLRNRNRWNRNR